MAKKITLKRVKKPAKENALAKEVIKSSSLKKKSGIKAKRLSTKELNIFKKNVLKFRDELTEQMKDISDNTLMKSQKDLSGDISGYGLHMADVATDNYERDFNLSLVSSERGVLLDIEDALKRIEDKTYGVCLSCNKFISKKRLEAIPYARYCTKCKNKLEQENKI